jgi:hypothetical protein
MSGAMTPRIDLTFLSNTRVRRNLVLGALGGAVLGIAYWGVAPRWYRSTLTVVPSKVPGSGGIASLMGGELGGLASSVAGFSGGTADNARIAAVLESTAVTDEVITRFNLRRRYDQTTQEGTRDQVWRHCGVRTLPKPNLVQLSCEDRDPKFVQEMVGHFAEIGNKVFARVNVGSASEEVRYLERRVNDLRRQADEAAIRVREFQETHQIVDLDSQARAVVSSVAGLNAQRISKQMELDYARTFASEDEAGTRQLESQLSVVDLKLQDLEESRGGARTGGKTSSRKGSAGLFPAALAVPKLRADYEKLYRDRKVAEASLVFALDRLEGAKASEARDVSTFQVLDPPTLPTRKSRPKGTESAVLGALLGCAVAVAIEWLRSRRAAAST